MNKTRTNTTKTILVRIERFTVHEPVGICVTFRVTNIATLDKLEQILPNTKLGAF